MTPAFTLCRDDSAVTTGPRSIPVATAKRAGRRTARRSAERAGIEALDPVLGGDDRQTEGLEHGNVVPVGGFADDLPVGVELVPRLAAGRQVAVRRQTTEVREVRPGPAPED